MAKRNEDLAKLQQLLILKGYLKAAQRSGRSAADGIMGPKTLAALDKARKEGYSWDKGKLFAASGETKAKEAVGNLKRPKLLNPFDLYAPHNQPSLKPKQKDLDKNTKNAIKKVSSQKSESKQPESKPNLQPRKSSGFSFGNVAEPYGMAALSLVKRELAEPNTPINPELKQFGINLVKNPSAAIIDASLSAVDRMGAPTNATNYLRDLNANLGYRITSAIRGGFNTLIHGGDYTKNRDAALANPSLLEDFNHISPLPVTEKNFSPEELKILSNMAGDKMYINNADIKRETPEGKYGGAEGIFKYFTPHKVVQTAIGQSSGNAKLGYITDLFDVNTSSKVAQHDNKMYLEMAKENPGFNYLTLRATMPYTSAVDIMPNRYKIPSKIQLK